MLRPDPETEFLGFSLADAVSTTLSSLDSLIVRSTLAASRFATADLDLRALADETNVDAALVGTLLRSGSQLRVSAQLLGVPEGTIIWVGSHRRGNRRSDPHPGRAEPSTSSTRWRCRSRRAISSSLHRDVPASARAFELYLRATASSTRPISGTSAATSMSNASRRIQASARPWARLGRCYRLTAKFRSSTVERCATT
jgi:hypothetical protein